MSRICRIVAFLSFAFLPPLGVCDDQDLTPEMLGSYIEALEGIKPPIDTKALVVRLKSVLGADAKVDESVEHAGQPGEFYNVDVDDSRTSIRIQFDGVWPNLAMPQTSMISVGGKDQNTLNCGHSPVGFERIYIRDLVKLYGPWTSYMDGSKTKSGISRLSFRSKSGILKINATGCGATDPNDIRVYWVTTDWPRPEWDQYYK